MRFTCGSVQSPRTVPFYVSNRVTSVKVSITGAVRIADLDVPLPAVVVSVRVEGWNSTSAANGVGDPLVSGSLRRVSVIVLPAASAADAKTALPAANAGVSYSPAYTDHMGVAVLRDVTFRYVVSCARAMWGGRHCDAGAHRYGKNVDYCLVLAVDGIRSAATGTFKLRNPNIADFSSVSIYTVIPVVGLAAVPLWLLNSPTRFITFDPARSCVHRFRRIGVGLIRWVASLLVIIITILQLNDKLGTFFRYYNQTPGSVITVVVATVCVGAALSHSFYIILTAACCCTRKERRHCCWCLPVPCARDAASNIDDRVSAATAWVRSRMRGSRAVRGRGCGCGILTELRLPNPHVELVESRAEGVGKRLVAAARAQMCAVAAWVHQNFLPLPRSEAFVFPQRLLVAGVTAMILSGGMLLLCDFLAGSIAASVGGWRLSVQGAASATEVAFDAASDAFDYDTPTYALNSTWNASADPSLGHLNPLLFAAPQALVVLTGGNVSANGTWPAFGNSTLWVQAPAGVANTTVTGGVWLVPDKGSAAYSKTLSGLAASGGSGTNASSTGQGAADPSANATLVSQLASVLSRSSSPSSFAQSLASSLVQNILVPAVELQVIETAVLESGALAVLLVFAIDIGIWVSILTRYRSRILEMVRG